MSSKRIVKNIFENTDNDKVAISSENNSKISFRDLKTFIEDISKLKEINEKLKSKAEDLGLYTRSELTDKLTN